MALVAGCYLLEGLFFSRRDAQEPPYIRPGTPLVGHLLAFLKKGTSYFGDVEYWIATLTAYPFELTSARAKFPNLAVFSLPIFSFKFYVVADRQVFAAVQRNAKSISFAPFSKRVTKILSNVSAATLRAIDTQSEDEEARSFARHVHHLEAVTLANGASQDRMNLVTAQEKLRMVDEIILESSKNPVNVELYDWVQHVATISATTGFYGPQNTHKDPTAMMVRGIRD